MRGRDYCIFLSCQIAGGLLCALWNHVIWGHGITEENWTQNTIIAAMVTIVCAIRSAPTQPHSTEDRG